jgi:hypothetical protein
VGDGVATANLAPRTLAQLITGNESELTSLPWVGHRSRSWEPEPLRWLGVNGGRLLLTGTDRAEARCGSPPGAGRPSRGSSAIEPAGAPATRWLRSASMRPGPCFARTRGAAWNTVGVSENKLVEQATEELYGLPPGDFTRARDARAKELRKEDREAADAIKALRKPTVAAWTLNQLARRRRKELDRLLQAGEELRAAQEELLAGGDRGAFQEAAAKERELVAELSAGAAALASEAGQSATGLQEKIAETLHAAALDEETANDLRAGCLVREREAIGGFGAAAMPPSAPRRPAKSGTKKTPSPPKAAKQSRKDDAEGRQRLAAAKTDERHARRELEAAQRALAHAEERAEAAAAHAAEAAERARTTAERLKEAKRAQAAAQKAHTKAERALDGAEHGSSGKP